MTRTYDDQNIFAKILRGDIPCDKVFENDHALAFNDIHPQAPVHILVIPKGPYPSFDDFAAHATPEEHTGFMAAIAEVCRIAGVESGFRAITNARTDGVQEVPHFHMHILGGRPMGRMLSPA